MEGQLRLFLLLAAAATFLATGTELLLIGHVESPLQLIPLGLCLAGLSAVMAAVIAPARPTLLTLRITMIGIAVGGPLGFYLHLRHNIAFELEIRPNAALGDVILDATGGASPMLASGILVLAAALALAGIHRHPGIGREPEATTR